MSKYITNSLILTGLLLANLFFWHDTFFGVLFLAIYAVYYGRRLAGLVLPKLNRFWHQLFGPLLLLLTLSIINTVAYYLYAINLWTITFSLLAIPASLIPYCHWFKKDINFWHESQLEAVPIMEPKTRLANAGAWLIILADFWLLYQLSLRATDAAIQTPWAITPEWFFPIFFVLTAFLLIAMRRMDSSAVSFLAIASHSFLMLSVAAAVYRLGFGFDPIIHRAAEEYINKFGAIAPKTPYYLGQYSLVVILHKLTFLPLEWWDRWLLPLLQAVFLPPAIFLMLRQAFCWQRQEARLGSLAILLIPFSSFIATTPQDLANFLALLAVFFAVLRVSGRLASWWLPIFLGIATLTAHPLTGLPVAFGLLLFWLWDRGADTHLLRRVKNIILPLVFLLALIILPLIFIFQVQAQFHLPVWTQVKALWPHLPQHRPDQAFSFSYAAIYYYDFFWPLLYLILSSWGGIQIWRQEKTKRAIIWSLTSIFLIFIINAAILKTMLTFANVGLAEQGQYPGRLWHFSFYTILPLFLYGLLDLLRRGQTNSREWWRWLNQPMALGILAAIFTASLYLSYPRVDAFAFSRYFNTSAADVAGAKSIAQAAAGEPYIVLANTSFSAGAISQNGFAKYFYTPQGELFYYSLPTGGPLYGFYEQMVYNQASRDVMLRAMNLAGASKGYLVLHDYWNSFKTALPQAQASAEKWWTIGNGKIYIFEYGR